MRLIDADELAADAERIYGGCWELSYGNLKEFIENAPTIEPPKAKAMSARDISNLMWAISVLEEIPTETIEQDRAISVGISAIQGKVRG